MISFDASGGRIRMTSEYVFGPFRLDPMRRLLVHGSDVVSLPERTFQILLLLIQGGGNVVEKETLAAKVWPDSAVSDGNLSQHIYMLRQTLGERASDRSYIMTVSGKGWRFAAPVEVASASPDYVAAENGITLGDLLLESGLEPFRYFCRGSQLLERRTAPCLWNAIEAFDTAIRLDESYAPAFVGLARSYALLAEFLHVPGRHAFPKAKEAIARALALDATSGLAHAVRSELLLLHDWAWEGSKRSLDAAAQLAPGSTFVRNNLAWFYLFQGSYKRALDEVQRALTMDPSSFHLLLLFARVLVFAGNYSLAIPCFTGLLEADPAFHIARRFRAQAYLMNGEPEQAIGDLLQLPQDRSEDPSFRLPLLGRAYADCGDLSRARDIHATLLEMACAGFVAHWNLAISAAGLGEDAEAMSRLQRAYDDREMTLFFLPSHRWFKRLENDRRFKDILKSVAPR
jgi:DNA-binding winged helix-turn-helix (wHTH) protein/tetratricopeptide (TPR) repeat protein